MKLGKLGLTSSGIFRDSREAKRLIETRTRESSTTKGSM
jgi:hypothetical protein